MAEATDPFISGRAPTQHYYHQVIPSKFRIFCDYSSIRGMQKISKSPTTFLRILWSSFVSLMTIGLIVTSGFLITDYLNYHTAWHTTTILDDKTEFPAISLCSHNPFSVEANKLWENEEIYTPTDFQNRLENISIKYAQHGDEYIGTYILLDTAENYYANLDFNSSVKLGHQRDMIYYCMIITSGYSTVAQNCKVEDLSNLVMVRFSHRQFFNCWTIQAAKGKTNFDIESIIMLISLTPSAEIDQMKYNFVMDMLTQGEGLKLVIHEANTYPDIDKDGINVQPGKMNEISYQPVRWTRLKDNPITPCKDNQYPIHDLDRVFSYSFSQCLDATLQKLIMEECGCMSTLYPRPSIPSASKPYCYNIINEERIKQLPKEAICYSKFLQKVKEVKIEAQKTVCFPRCNFHTYETKLSVTSWKPTKYKLNRLSKIYSLTDNFYKNSKNKSVQDTYIKGIKTKKNKQDNESSSPVLNIFDKMNLFSEDRFTYVSLNRKNPDTTLKIEKLVLDIYILISRIGGLCSLCIGLTTAFFIELIEFVYLSLHVEKHRRKNTMINSGGAAGANKQELCSSPVVPNSAVCQKFNPKHCSNPGCSLTSPSAPLPGEDGGKLRSKFLPHSLSSPKCESSVPSTCDGCDQHSPWHRVGNNICNVFDPFKEEPVSTV